MMPQKSTGFIVIFRSFQNLKMKFAKLEEENKIRRHVTIFKTNMFKILWN